MTETKTRTLVRAIVWRIIATLITAVWTGLSGAIVINIFMTIAHYIHERAWLRINWGTSVNSLAQINDRVDTK